MKPRNEDPQIGADDNGEWEQTPKLDRLFLLGAIIWAAFGLLTWWGFL